MCGRYTIQKDFGSVIDAFSPLIPLFPASAWRKRYNVAPSQDIPILRINSNGDRVLSFARWGLIPAWTKGKPKFQPINARAETVSTSGMFRQAFARRRCLIPADGFYEWKKLGPKEKQPMYARRQDGGIFAFAGLWERWVPEPDAEPVDTCTIITTTANAVMSPIHDRMPVLLHPTDYSSWLNRETAEQEITPLLRPYPAAEMEAYAVSSMVNSPKNEGEECVNSL